MTFIFVGSCISTNSRDPLHGSMHPIKIYIKDHYGWHCGGGGTLSRGLIGIGSLVSERHRISRFAPGSPVPLYDDVCVNRSKANALLKLVSGQCTSLIR